MAFPALYLLLSAIVFDIPARHCVSLLLSPSYYLLCFWAVLTGFSLWEMKRWSWYVFLLTNVLIGYSNAIVVSQYGETHHKLIAFIFSILMLIMLMFRVGREVRVPYFVRIDPQTGKRTSRSYCSKGKGSQRKSTTSPARRTSSQNTGTSSF